MLNVTIDKTKGIAMLEPDGPLAKNDFLSAAASIDPFIEASGKLKGLLIHTRQFPGWDSFAALTGHLTFIKEHHRKISRLAFVTDSKIVDFTKPIADHFVNAEIRIFPYDQLSQAEEWAAGDA